MVFMGPAAHADAHQGTVKNPLQVPAMKSAIAPRSPLISVAMAGKRIVGVGLRGVIVYSDDQGKNWTQASVPVSADLTDLAFPTAKQGWAVGHDGAVLHTTDGGKNWTLQMGGNKAARMLVNYYKRKVDAGHEKLQHALNRSKFLAKHAPAISFLDVWFKNARLGFIVGEFGIMLKTEDGGKTWHPWYEHTHNPRFRHLYSIHGSEEHVYITGEQGIFLSRDPASHTFESEDLPYDGSFFGVTAQGDLVMVYGLRGHAYLSRDGGHNWHTIQTPTSTTFTAGEIKGDQVILATQGGKIYYSTDQGRHFEAVSLAHTRPIYGLALINQNKVALVGPSGLWADTLN